MQKEQPGVSEHGHGAASSKNAKNKSNRMTLLAIREAKDDSRGRGSRCSSEKDSGYSDGSDWQQTDVEDQRSNKSQSRGSEPAETSQPGQTKDPGQGNPGKPTLMPACHELQPIYIINNMVLQQPDTTQKRGPLPRRNGSRETSGSGAAHVILLQQPGLLPAALQHHKPSSRKSNVTGRKINGAYLPILNSYPRIAPHPSKKPPDKSLSSDESQNLSKRVCTEHKSDDTPVTRSLPEHNLALTSGLSSSTSRSSSSPTTVSSSQGSPSGSSLHTTSSLLASRGLHRNGTTSTRHQRFLNTVQILRQSGLLDITLRTKELLRQSNATERNIAQLRQHTELLCQAASCSRSDIAAWEHLHRAMAESGSYPDLKILQSVHPDSASQPPSISTGAVSSEVSPPPRFLTAIPHPEQGRELNTSSEKAFMSPDSSTG